MPSRPLLFTKLAIAFILLTILVGYVDWRDTAQHLLNADPIWGLLAVCIVCSSIAISAWRWHRLVALVAGGLTLGRAMRLYWIGTFCGNFMPTSIAGDAVRAVAARDHGGILQMAVIIMIERLTGLFVVLLIAAAALPAFAGAAWLPVPMPYAMTGLLALSLSIPVMIVMAQFVLGWQRRAAWAPAMPGFARRIAAQLADASNALQGSPRLRIELVVTLAISLLFYATLVASQYAQLRAVGAIVPIEAVVAAVPAIVLVSILPISLNGLGVAEGVFVLIYAHFGIDPELALAAAVLRRITIMLAASLGALFILNPSRRQNHDHH